MSDPSMIDQYPSEDARFSEIERACEAFQAEWQTGKIPDLLAHLEQFASQGSPARGKILLELVLIDLERRWQRSHTTTVTFNENTTKSVETPKTLVPSFRPKIEDYLKAYPDLGTADQLPLEAIALEYRVRHVWGDRPSHEEFLRRFPQQASELRHRLEQMDEDVDAPDTARDGLSTDRVPASPRRQGLRVRCAHCHYQIELVDEKQDALGNISCPSCGSHFSLIDNRGNSTTSLPTVKRLGHFELIEELGVGAFGSVWKARDTELDRAVAVKIPRKDQLEPGEMEQFLREARAAAQLKHPNIVTVYEVGRQDDTVYIVSDLVRGVALDEWLTGQQLNSREAAELCAKLAEAVHHAHEAGVIHRDLKPGNILLDGEGEPHVMDFGLAKREAGEITMTVEGRVLGTPAYMSPEQARGEGHHADRRTDVYSLGVILFQLLTGELPFRGTPRMLLHQVLNSEPRSPRTLNDRIPRDLETVTLKCMQKDPDRRYTTTRELAADLQRWLEGKPIEARPIGRIEKSWRWCKRNPLVAGLASAVLSLAIVSALAAVLISVQRNEAIRARNEALSAQAHASQIALAEHEARVAQEEAQAKAAAAQKRAEDEAQAAQQVSDFLVGMFQASDTLGITGSRIAASRQIAPDASVHEVLEIGTETLAANPDLPPLVRARLLDEIGVVFLNLGQFEKGLQLVEEGLAIRKQQSSHLDHQIAVSLTHQGGGKFVLGYADESARILQEALSIYDQIGDGDSFDASSAHMLLAWNYVAHESMRQMTNESRSHAEKALEIRKNLVPADSRDLAVAYLCLAAAQLDDGDQNAAFDSLLKGVSIFSALPGGETVAEAATEISLYFGALGINAPEAAEEHGRRAIERMEAAFGASNPFAGSVGWSIAGQLSNQGRSSEADVLYRAAETSWRKTLEGQPQLAGLLVARANCLKNIDRYDDAERLLLEALEIYHSKSFEDQPYYVNCLESLGSVCEAKGNFSDAEGYYRQAIEVLEKLAHGNPDDLLYQNRSANIYNDLGLLLKETGRVAEAERFFKQAIQIYEELVDGNPAVAKYQGSLQNSYCYLGELLGEMGHVAEAEESYTRAIEICKELVHSNPGDLLQQYRLGNNYMFLGGLLSGTPRVSEAEQNFAHAIKIGEELVHGNPAEAEYLRLLARSYCNLGILLSETARFDAAEQYFGRAIGIFERLVESKPAVALYQHQLASFYRHIGNAQNETGRVVEAERSYERAIEICKKLIHEFPGDLDYERLLALAYRDLGLLQAEAGRSTEAKQSFDRAIEISERLVGEISEVPKYRSGLGDSYWHAGELFAMSGRYPEAIKCFHDAIAIDCEFPRKMAKIASRFATQAALLLEADQIDLYRELSGEFLDATAATDNPSIAHSVAWGCVLSPAVGDIQPALRLAQFAVDSASPEQEAAHRRTLGGALYRAERNEEAIEQISRAIETSDDHQGTAYDWVFLAMAHRRLGHTEQAMQWLAKTRAWISENAPSLLSSKVEASVPSNLAKQPHLELGLIFREAETVIQN